MVVEGCALLPVPQRKPRAAVRSSTPHCFAQAGGWSRISRRKRVARAGCPKCSQFFKGPSGRRAAPGSQSHEVAA